MWVDQTHQVDVEFFVIMRVNCSNCFCFTGLTRNFTLFFHVWIFRTVALCVHLWIYWQGWRILQPLFVCTFWCIDSCIDKFGECFRSIVAVSVFCVGSSEFGISEMHNHGSESSHPRGRRDKFGNAKMDMDMVFKKNVSPKLMCTDNCTRGNCGVIRYLPGAAGPTSIPLKLCCRVNFFQVMRTSDQGVKIFLTPQHADLCHYRLYRMHLWPCKVVPLPNTLPFGTVNGKYFMWCS